MKYIWVGPRESDTLFSNNIFENSVTYSGSNTANNISLSAQMGKRINTNHHTSQVDVIPFLKQHLLTFVNKPDVSLMFYNPLMSYRLGEDFISNTVCANSQSVLRLTHNKANMRTMAQECMPTVPFVHFKGNNMPGFQFKDRSSDEFVLQKSISSGGYGTYLFNLEQCAEYLFNQPDNISYIISPFFNDAIPINVHVVIFEDSCIVFPPSYQLVQSGSREFSYIGADYHTDFPKTLYSKIIEHSTAFARKLSQIGYRGVCGIDYMMTREDVYFLELNARFQASSFMLNKQLIQEQKKTLHELNLLAFTSASPPYDSFSKFREPESFFTVMGDNVPAWYSEISPASNACCEIIADGFSPESDALDTDAYLFRIMSKRNLCWLDSDFELRLAPNIRPDSSEWKAQILNKSPLHMKISLLNQGVRISSAAQEQMTRQGTIRKGVFHSIDITFPNGLIINAPFQTDFSVLSPYCVDWQGKYVLCYQEHVISSVEFDAADPYQYLTATEGTTYISAAFLATDRLRVHHQFRCAFKKEGKGCRFCNIKLKEGGFSLSDVCEIFDFYLENAEFRHILIGGGSGKYEAEDQSITEIAKHVRKSTSKEIYVMCLPPQNVSTLKEFHAAGINQIGFNLEVFDRNIACQLMSGKGTISLEQYENAFREAVKLWGRNGSVRSMLVLGLEPINSLYAGVEWLCKLGVMPILSIYRPLNNIELTDVLPHSNEKLALIYKHAEELARQYGLTLGPECVACQNNTLSLPSTFKH